MTVLTAYLTPSTVCSGHAACQMMCCMVAGINDPYEAPERPEITLDVDDPQGRRQSPEAMARIILAYLEVSHARCHLSLL